ncbi:MAG: cytochrome c oxidase assembly protein [Burkholderiales bacterium]|nr:cytochrome c oxidase assembly protein [Burkholderiales bacterium]
MRLIVLAAALSSGLAHAHAVDARPDAYAVAAWAVLAAAALGYGAAWRRGAALRARNAAAFGGGWTALALARLVTPDAPAPFALHMVQHELMMLAAPPLLILGRPFTALASLAPRPLVRGAAIPLRVPPLAAWGCHAAALWVWHVPRLFDAAAASPHLHALQHATFFASALLFWWTVFRRLRRGTAVFYILTTFMHTGALAALLTFAPAALYADTPLAEQQLGGLIMWVPAGFVMLVAGLVAFDRLLVERP